MNKQLLGDYTWEHYEIPTALCEELRRNELKKPSMTYAKFYEAVKEDKTRSGMLEAPTGTGKTIAFLTHILTQVDPKDKRPQAVIFVHTQILGYQVLAEVQKLQSAVGVESSLLLGYSANVPFNKNVQVVVATPNAFVEHFVPKYMRGKTSPAYYENRIKILVLDEADFYWRDSNMRENMNRIFGSFNQAQVLLFSATIDKELASQIKQQYLYHHKNTFSERYEVTLDNTSHYYLKIASEAYKLQILQRLFDLDIYESGFKAIIFCKARAYVDAIYEVIVKAGYEASRYHSDMTQVERQQQYAKFLKGESRVLISTDMLARGIDIVSIALVINYEIPTEGAEREVSPQNYVHRTGRSGRFGRRSVAVTFVFGDTDDRNMKQIMKYVDRRFGKENLIQQLQPENLEKTIAEDMKNQKADEQTNAQVLEVMGEANDEKRALTHQKSKKPFKDDKRAEKRKDEAENPYENVYENVEQKAEENKPESHPDIEFE